jgi:hypothetical protein
MLKLGFPRTPVDVDVDVRGLLIFFCDAQLPALLLAYRRIYTGALVWRKMAAGNTTEDACPNCAGPGF